MPKNRFFNLPEEKKNRIIKATINELSRVSDFEISINKIIQEAGIPRGSFYQYFEDKNDLIQYIMQDYIQLLKTWIEKTLKTNEGDIFKTINDTLNAIVEFGQESNNVYFLNNVLRELKGNFECPIGIVFKTKEDIFKIMIENINRETLNISTDQALTCLLEMLFSVLRDAVARNFYNIDNHQDNDEIFVEQLKIIKNGSMKEKK